MRGRFTIGYLGPRNPSSDLAPLGHLLPQGEKDRNGKELNITALGLAVLSLGQS